MMAGIIRVLHTAAFSRNQKSVQEVRSQKTLGERLQQFTNCLKKRNSFRCFIIPQIIRQNQIVSAFFDRPLRDIEKAGFVRFVAFAKAFRYVRCNRHSGTPELRRQSVYFVFGKCCSYSIESKDKRMSFLPNHEVIKCFCRHFHISLPHDRK